MTDTNTPRPDKPAPPPDIFSANLPSPSRPKPDSRLQHAVEEAQRMHQVTPILKEELRAAIMLRRLSSGQGEITLDKPSTTEYKLTPEEVTKKERRKAQNRLAAQRCRSKKRQEHDTFLKIFSEQNNKRQKLEDEVTTLREEKRRLEALLVHHMLTRACQKGHVTMLQNGRSTSCSPAISTSSCDEDSSFYDVLQIPKKEVPDSSSASPLPNSSEPELPTEDMSLIYSLDSHQYLTDLTND